MRADKRRVLALWGSLGRRLANKAAGIDGEPDFLDGVQVQGDADAVLRRILNTRTKLVADVMSKLGEPCFSDNDLGTWSAAGAATDAARRAPARRVPAKARACVLSV
eukprot:CAMPEP_0174947626 /NCGR_PEP_ID=MMETSP1355-20121228/87057_1 /TAXON_ID=464990 /ORGANISM="Hemiselmis tepida, Strain CCMP443" /LENGTH=106 /DNA_ID=CAMNT_0016195109 /DNA_START=50 /DNA_END=367 /DNA_ORIENTATION=-